MENAVEKFAGKAEIYQKYRPDYAAACLDFLVRGLGWTAGKTIADVGAGTGIFTRQLLERGLRVQAVEPGADMLAVLRAADWPGHPPEIREGSAACTGLPDGSVDGVAAAQAFHWFDAAAFRAECRRILRPGGYAALIWNTREAEHPLTKEAAAICAAHCPGFTGFSGGEAFREENIALFFGGGFQKKTFDHPIPMNREAFIGRYLSASYAPGPADAAYRPFIWALEGLFSAYAQAAPGRDQAEILFPNRTCCYAGHPAGAKGQR